MVLCAGSVFLTALAIFGQKLLIEKAQNQPILDNATRDWVSLKVGKIFSFSGRSSPPIDTAKLKKPEQPQFGYQILNKTGLILTVEVQSESERKTLETLAPGHAGVVQFSAPSRHLRYHAEPKDFGAALHWRRDVLGADYHDPWVLTLDTHYFALSVTNSEPVKTSALTINEEVLNISIPPHQTWLLGAYRTRKQNQVVVRMQNGSERQYFLPPPKQMDGYRSEYLNIK